MPIRRSNVGCMGIGACSSVNCRPQGGAWGNRDARVSNLKPRPFCSVLQRPACWVWRSPGSPRLVPVATRAFRFWRVRLFASASCSSLGSSWRSKALRHWCPGSVARSSSQGSRLIASSKGKQCGLTLRSTDSHRALGPPPEWFIIRPAGQAPHRRSRLSSNVRRLNTPPRRHRRAYDSIVLLAADSSFESRSK